MSPTPQSPVRVFRVPSTAGSSLILEHGGRNYDLSHGIERARHGDVLELVQRGFFDNFQDRGEAALARRVLAPPPSQVLTPLEPRQIGKILALAMPPRELLEQAPPGPESPWFSNRSPKTLAASGDSVDPSELGDVGDALVHEPCVLRHELFLAVVIARRARDVDVKAAAGSIAGYMVASDFTRRSLDGRPRTPWFGESPGGTLVVGPAFVPSATFDAKDVAVRARRQRGGRAEPGIEHLGADLAQEAALAVAAMSRVAILHPGDILLVPTGVSLGVVENGDELRCAIEGLGELVTSVESRTRLRQQA